MANSILPKEITDQFDILAVLPWIMLALVTVSYSMRLYVKLILMRSFRYDDVALLCAVILFLPVVVTTYLFSRYGHRLEAGDLSVLPAITLAAKILNPFYAICTIACKVSVALLVLNLLGPHSTPQRLLTYAITTISSVLGLVFFSFCFTCGILNIERTGGKCRYTRAANTVSTTWSVSNMIADLVFAVLCVNLIWRATMSLRTRIIASTLLSFSSVGAVVSILRVATLLGWGWTLLDTQRLIVSRWSLLEAGICIAAICMSSLRPLLRKVIGSQGSTLGVSGARSRPGATTGPYSGTANAMATAEGPRRKRGNSEGAESGESMEMKIGVKTVIEIEESDLLEESRMRQARADSFNA